MKIYSIIIKKISFPVLILLFASLLFTSCKKDGVQSTSEAAGLMVYNLIPDKAAVDFTIDGVNLLSQPVAYTNFSGAYLPVSPGNRVIAAYNSYDRTTLAQRPVTLKDSGYYSLFAMGADETYQNVFVRDNFASLPTGSGNAFIRFVNAIPDSSEPSVIVTLRTDIVVNTELKYTQISDFMPVTPGDINIVLANTDHTIDVNRTISVIKDGTYTILFTGLPGATDTEKEVKVLYIQNGTIAP